MYILKSNKVGTNKVPKIRKKALGQIPLLRLKMQVLSFYNPPVIYIFICFSCILTFVFLNQHPGQHGRRLQSFRQQNKPYKKQCYWKKTEQREGVCVVCVCVCVCLKKERVRKPNNDFIQHIINS